MYFSTSYMHCIYSDPKDYGKLVETVVARVLELQKSLKFQAIAFRGTSGAAMAYPVSAATGIPLICIRKDGSHHGGPVEGSALIDVKKYLIIDDFISGGTTMDKIIDVLKTACGKKVLKCVGILLYGDDHNRFNNWKKVPITRIK